MAPICCEDLRLKGEKKPKPRSFPLSRRRNTQSSPPPRMQISPSFPGVEWKRKWLVLFFYQVLASDKRNPSKESPGQTTRSISTEDLVSRFQLPNLFSWLDRLSSTVLNLVTFNLDQSIPLHCTSEAIPSCSKVLGTFCHTYNGVKLKCYSLLPPILRGGEEEGGGVEGMDWDLPREKDRTGWKIMGRHHRHHRRMAQSVDQHPAVVLGSVVSCMSFYGWHFR